MSRLIYELKDNYIDSVSTQNFYGTPYMMYLNGGKLIVNRSRKERLRRDVLLTDIYMLAKNKERGELLSVKGLSKNYIEFLEEKRITKQDIKEAIERGKNSLTRGRYIRKITSKDNPNNTRYVVAYQ